MSSSCIEKQQRIKALFASCDSDHDKYQKIIEIGRGLQKMDPQHKIVENIIKGCQSTVYLHSYVKDGLLYFEIESEALISSGLAALLILAYNGEPPEVILKQPPSHLEELRIAQTLTPGRSNGLYSIHLRMKQNALNHIRLLA